MKHIIAVLLENEPGALSRVVGLFSARGYNIESLTVAPTEDPSLSRMTIQTTGSDDIIEQMSDTRLRTMSRVNITQPLPRRDQFGASMWSRVTYTASRSPLSTTRRSRASFRARACWRRPAGDCASRRSTLFARRCSPRSRPRTRGS